MRVYYRPIQGPHAPALYGGCSILRNRPVTKGIFCTVANQQALDRLPGSLPIYQPLIHGCIQSETRVSCRSTAVKFNQIRIHKKDCRCSFHVTATAVSHTFTPWESFFNCLDFRTLLKCRHLAVPLRFRVDLSRLAAQLTHPSDRSQGTPTDLTGQGFRVSFGPPRSGLSGHASGI